MTGKYLKNYAKLVVETGVNIQPDQLVVIHSPLECADFSRMIADTAFQRGARDVVVSWRDEKFDKIRYLAAPDEVFNEFPKWRKDFYLSALEQGAAFISIAAEDPTLFKTVDPRRITAAQKARGRALKEYQEKLMRNFNAWTVVSVPTEAWAKQVFSDLSATQAVDALWQAIAQTVRLDQDDPVDAWQKHQENLKKRLDFLNSQHFTALHYHNSLGTDVTIELPTGHIWFGGADHTPAGIEFMANMPTEEVYTLPKKNGINGKIVSSRPFNYNGNIIEGFSFTCHEGKIIDCQAKNGEKILRQLLDTDEGSRYLGEVALVPYDSPISNLKLLFYNTLFDENASCHLALGKAYPVCIEGGEQMNSAELAAAGVNDSLIHEDFMVGTADLEIEGITRNNHKIPVFKAGNFAF